MKYFQIVTGTGFKWVILQDDRLYECFTTIPKPSQPHDLIDVHVKQIDVNAKKKYKKGDVFWFGGGGIVLTEKAAQVLKPVLYGVELLSMIDTNNEVLFFVNPPHLNCISLSDSEYLPCPTTGVPLIFSKTVLRTDIVASYSIMRTLGRRPGTVFVSSDFVECFRKNGLVGIDFEEVEAV